MRKISLIPTFIIGGLGILITKKTMDSITYVYENGENVLTMIKKI